MPLNAASRTGTPSTIPGTRLSMRVSMAFRGDVPTSIVATWLNVKSDVVGTLGEEAAASSVSSVDRAPTDRTSPSYVKPTGMIATGHTRKVLSNCRVLGLCFVRTLNTRPTAESGCPALFQDAVTPRD